MNKNVLIVVFIVVGLVILEFAVLLGYQKLKPINKIESTNNSASSNVKESPFDKSIFSSQNATIEGDVIGIEGGNISIRNKQGVSDTFTASPKMAIYKYSSRFPQASASSDLKSIELNLPAIIALEYRKDQYQIVAISYLSAKLSNK